LERIKRRIAGALQRRLRARTDLGAVHQPDRLRAEPDLLQPLVPFVDQELESAVLQLPTGQNVADVQELPPAQLRHRVQEAVVLYQVKRRAAGYILDLAQYPGVAIARQEPLTADTPDGVAAAGSAWMLGVLAK
jgi:hypothetical protein